MGNGFSLRCTCGYTTEVALGVGFLSGGIFYVPPSEYEESLKGHITNKAERDLVIRLMTQKGGEAFDLGLGLYRCEKCNKLGNYLHYRIKHSDGSHEPTYKCPKCKQSMLYLGQVCRSEEEAEEEEKEEGIKTNHINIETIPCPKCGKKELAIGNSFLWD